MGFNPPRAGQALFAGRDITRHRLYRIAADGIGLIPQGRRNFCRRSRMRGTAMMLTRS